MASRAVVALGLVTVAACGGGGRHTETAPLEGPAQEKPPATCRAVVPHELDVILASSDTDPGLRDEIIAARDQIEAELIADCESAAPPVAVLECMLGAQTTDAMVACVDPGGTGDLRAPTAADLARYTSDLTGEGAMIAILATSEGVIHCALAEQEAPATVANFVGLARGLHPWIDPRSGKVVEGRPYYDGLTFHRVIPDFMIQGGDPLGNGTGGPGYEIADEASGVPFDQPGRLAMANAGPDTGGSQFFITEVDTAHLDGKHTVFGTCGDLDVVRAIARVPAGSDDQPIEPVVIEKITITRGN